MEKKKVYRKIKTLKPHSAENTKQGTKLFLSTVKKHFRKDLDQAEQTVAKQKTKKNKYVNLIFFLINLVVIGVILGIQIGQSEDMSFTALLTSTFSLEIFALMLFMWFVIQGMESLRMNILIRQSTGRSRPFLAYKTHAYGKYYDSITPMASGGQPFQIFYMTKRGLNAASAISVPMGKYVVQTMCTSFLWTIAVIASFFVDLGSNFNFIRPLCIIGWAINATIMVGVLLLSVNQRLGKKLVVWALKFLQKIKIIKDYEKRYNQVIKVVTDFQVTIKNYAKRIWSFLLQMTISLTVLVINYSFPFLVYSCLIGYFDFSMYFTLLLLSILIDMAASFVPLPGGTGVNELSFTALFAMVFSSNVMLTWALLLWRFMTYYAYLLQGLFVLVYDNVIGNKKYKWLKKKWELEAESINFTEEKIHEYNQNKNKSQRTIF